MKYWHLRTFTASIFFTFLSGIWMWNFYWSNLYCFYVSEGFFTSCSCSFCSQLMTKHPKVADQLWPNWASIQWSQPASASGDRSYSRVPQDNKRCLLLSLFLKHFRCQISLKLWPSAAAHCHCPTGLFRMACCLLSWRKSWPSEMCSE